MENQHPTIGFEDGTIDVERLLAEPQDGHASVDSVICFNEKNPQNKMEIQEVSCSFGASNTGIAHKGRDIFNGDVYSLHSEVEGGYFRLHNDFCSMGMGEEYLLGVEFAESIANPNYVSSECLQTSVSDHSILASGASSVSPWKTDLFRIMEVPYCHNEEQNVKSSEFVDIGSPEILIEEKSVKSPTSCTLRDISKFHDISSCSFQDTLSDENMSLPQSVEMLCSPKNDESGTSQNGQISGFQEKDSLVTLLSRARQADALPTQKRSRKPTRRYIVEVADPIPRQLKRKREVSSTAFKDKFLGVKDHKKRHMGSRAITLPAEESSVKAIQVPFASLVHKESPKGPAYDTVHSSDRGNVMTKPRNNCVTPENQKKKDECIPAVHLRKRSDSITTTQKKKGEDVTGAHLKKSDELSITIHLIKGNDSFTAANHKKKDENVTRARLKRRNDHLTALSQKKSNDSLFTMSPKKEDNCLRLVRQKKRDDYDYDYAPAESPEEVNGKRKHHRLWTIAEVNSLIDGVSEHGVGRWSRIKKLFFSSSAHRTSVDLKDKWRNLLKACGMQGECNHEVAFHHFFCNLVCTITEILQSKQPPMI
ncbi:hypothetical protein ACS0TY_015056 [Phlomoides rotata]